MQGCPYDPEALEDLRCRDKILRLDYPEAAELEDKTGHQADHQQEQEEWLAEKARSAVRLQRA